MGIIRSIRRSFWRGLAALVPVLLTVVVIVLFVSFVHHYIGQHVNTLIKAVVQRVFGWPQEDIDAWFARYFLVWVGPVVGIVGLCVAAYFLGTFLGNRLVRLFDGWLVKLPILRRIYPGAKQVSEFFFSERQVEFRRVVAIEYPRRGVWSIGFVTGRSFRALCRHTEQELLTVFVPSSPTPVTGYTVAVPRREVIDLPITVDEAFQYSISGGVIVPSAERLESLEAALLVMGEKQRAAAEAERGSEEEEPEASPEAEEAADAEAEADAESEIGRRQEGPAPQSDEPPGPGEETGH